MKRAINTGVKLASAGFLSAVLLLIPERSFAAEFFYLFNDAGGNTASSPSDSPVSIFFQDVAPGVVNINISNNGAAGTEFLRRTTLNLVPGLDPTGLQFMMIDGSENLDSTKVKTSEKGFHVKHAGRYGINIKFKTSEQNRFNVGDYVVYQVSGMPGLSAADFIAQSSVSSKDQPYFSAAKFKPGSSEGLKGWTFSAEGPVPVNPVPEPTTIAFFSVAAGLVALGRFSAKRR